MEKTELHFQHPILPLSHWSSQLFYLRVPLSTDVPILLLNQPNNQSSSCPLWGFLRERMVGGGELLFSAGDLLTFPPYRVDACLRWVLI